MDLSSLSSNWKKLQQSLNAQKASNGVDGREGSTGKRGVSSADGKSRAAIALGEKRKRHSPKIKTDWTGATLATKRRRINDSSAHERGGDRKQRNLKITTTDIDPKRRFAQRDKAEENIPQEQQQQQQHATSKQKIGRFVALDCEMVGIGSSSGAAESENHHHTRGSTRSILVPPHAVPVHRRQRGTLRHETHSLIARVSMVSYTGEPVYDAYVQPPRHTRIINYRTEFSGIRPWHLSGKNPNTPKPLAVVQQEVGAILQGRILVGHALDGDLEALDLKGVVARARTRDTSLYPRYRRLLAEFNKNSNRDLLLASSSSAGAGNDAAAAAEEEGGGARRTRTPALRRLAKRILGWDIQNDWAAGHSSIEDARAAMELFKIQKRGFEDEARRLYGAAATAASSPGGVAAVASASPGCGGVGTASAIIHTNNNNDDDDDDDDDKIEKEGGSSSIDQDDEDED